MEDIVKVGFISKQVEWIHIPKNKDLNSFEDYIRLAIQLYDDNEIDFIEELQNPLDSIIVDHEEDSV